VEGEQGFLKSRVNVKFQIVLHILSVGHVVMCSGQHFQMCYSINKSFISVCVNSSYSHPYFVLFPSAQHYFS
jgi:hypothetical protein